MGELVEIENKGQGCSLVQSCAGNNVERSTMVKIGKK